MYIPKRYGQSKTDSCPFCQKQATTTNKAGVPVCQDHKNEDLGNMKCVCGEYLDMKKGKFGVFFTCMNCGNVNLNKALDMNNSRLKIGKVNQAVSRDPSEKPSAPKPREKKETVVRSDDPFYFT